MSVTSSAQTADFQAATKAFNDAVVTDITALHTAYNALTAILITKTAATGALEDHLAPTLTAVLED